MYTWYNTLKGDIVYTLETLIKKLGRSKKLILKTIQEQYNDLPSEYDDDDYFLLKDVLEKKKSILSKRIQELLQVEQPMSIYDIKRRLGVSYQHILWAVTDMTFNPEYKGLYETDEGKLSFWTKEEMEEFKDILGGWD